MVILIAAASSTGKTLMAQRLLERYHFPYLSIDHLKMGLFRADEAGCPFHPESSTEVIEAALWPILKGIIMTSIENGQHIIIEGCYLSPSRPAEFEEFYGKQIIPVFMGFSEGYIRRELENGILAHRSAIEQRGYPDDRTAGMMIEEHTVFRAKCLDCGFPYFEIDGDYEEETGKIYVWIDQEISRLANKSIG